MTENNNLFGENIFEYDIFAEDIMFASNPVNDDINDIFNDVDEIF